MSLVKTSRPIERSYGDFIISFNYLPKSGFFVTIKDRNDRIDPTTFHLREGKLEDKLCGGEVTEADMFSTLTKKAAEKGYNISDINDESFEEGILTAIKNLREDLKKRHPRKYKDI